MATVVKTTRPKARTSSSVTRSRQKTVTRRKHQWSTSELVALWLARHAWRGTRTAVRFTATRTGSTVARTARHTHGAARQWAADTGRWGAGRGVGECGCGWRGPADRINTHPCGFDDEPLHPADGFSGDWVRADEPPRRRAWAQRLDREPMEELTAEEKENTMNDPSNWGQSAETLGDPALSNTAETIDWFEQAANGAARNVEYFDQLCDYLDTIEMDKQIRDAIDDARDHAAQIHHAFTAAHKRAVDLWADVSVPRFEKAS